MHFFSCFSVFHNIFVQFVFSQQRKKVSNDQELTQSNPKFCPQNQKGNN